MTLGSALLWPEAFRGPDGVNSWRAWMGKHGQLSDVAINLKTRSRHVARTTYFRVTSHTYVLLDFTPVNMCTWWCHAGAPLVKCIVPLIVRGGRRLKMIPNLLRRSRNHSTRDSFASNQKINLEKTRLQDFDDSFPVKMCKNGKGIRRRIW